MSANPAPHTNAEKRYGRTHAIPRGHTAQPFENENRRATINVIKDTPLLPRVPPTAVPGLEKTEKMAQHDLPFNNQMITKNKVRRRQHAQARPTVGNSTPSCNTRSQTRTTTTAASKTIPTTRSSKRMSQLMRTTPAKRNNTTQREHAEAIEERLNSKHLQQTTQKINNLEIELNQAMLVMYEQTGQLLYYKQLMRDTKYKKNWITSSAN